MPAGGGGASPAPRRPAPPPAAGLLLLRPASAFPRLRWNGPQVSPFPPPPAPELVQGRPEVRGASAGLSSLLRFPSRVPHSRGPGEGTGALRLAPVSRWHRRLPVCAGGHGPPCSGPQHLRVPRQGPRACPPCPQLLSRAAWARGPGSPGSHTSRSWGQPGPPLSGQGWHFGGGAEEQLCPCPRAGCPWVLAAHSASGHSPGWRRKKPGRPFPPRGMCSDWGEAGPPRAGPPGRGCESPGVQVSCR